MIRVQRGELTILELNNPPLNLVTAEMTRELDATLDALAADGDIAR